MFERKFLKEQSKAAPDVPVCVLDLLVMTCIGSHVKQEVINRCTWQMNLTQRELGEGRNFLIDDTGWCFCKTVEDIIHFVWTLTSPGQYLWKTLNTSWAASTQLALAYWWSPSCWWAGMVCGHRYRQACSLFCSLCAIPFLSFPLAPEITALQSVTVLFCSAVVFTRGQGGRSALTLIGCCMHTARRQPQPLCVDDQAGQAAGERLPLFYYAGRSQKWKVFQEETKVLLNCLALNPDQSQPSKNRGDLLLLSKLVSRHWSKPASLHDMAHSLLCCHHY